MNKETYHLDDVFKPAIEAGKSLLTQTTLRPRTAIVLGSGIQVLEDLQQQTSIPYGQITSFPQTTVKGHQGVVTMGMLEEIPVAIFRGRFHRYEGHPWRHVVFPITMMQAIGIENIIMTNSAGGLNRFFTPGDLMVIRDHVYWQFADREERAFIFQQVGNRHQPRYSSHLIQAALEAGIQAKVPLQEGIYSSLTGPTYETPGEVHLLTHAVRADAMGMSTVPEAIWATCLKMRVVALSCITNVATNPTALAATSHEEVVQVAQASSLKLDRLLKHLLPLI